MRDVLKNLFGISKGLAGNLIGGLSISNLITSVAAIVIAGLLIWVALLKADLSNCTSAHATYVATQEKAARSNATDALSDSKTAAHESGAIDAAHEKELDDAKAAADALRVELDAARKRLRKRFTCPTPGVLPSPGVAAGAGPADEAAGLRSDDAAFLVGTGDAADADIRALQALVLSYRKACNG